MMFESERRRQQRFPLHTRISLLRPSSLADAGCVCRNVSTGGIYFYADSWQDGVKELEFCVELPAQLTFGSMVTAKCSATVLRVDRDGLSKPGIAARVQRWTML